MRPRRDLVHRRGRRNVERGVPRVSPSQIGRLLGHDNGSQMMTGRVPNPYSTRTDDLQISLEIDFHSIRHALFGAAGLDAEDAPVAEFAVSKVVNTDVPLLRVVYVELRALG